jgi:prepilin-type N-terminal cleavage/methylation domain-containing protein
MWSNRVQPARRSPRRQRRGFTLIEASMTTVIVGIGVLALMELLASGTVSNIRGTEMTTGVNLAKNIRELALQKTFAELPAMNNVSRKPPIDSRGEELTDMSEWQQEIKVESVDPSLLTTPLPAATPQALRITATINRNGRKVCDLHWFSFAP